MYYVQCPRCGGVVDLPPEAIGHERTDPWNVAHCEGCELGFDYDDEEVQSTPDASEVSPG